MARRASGAAEQPRDLARMRERLEEWRGGHARGVALPEALWSGAGRFACFPGIARNSLTAAADASRVARANGRQEHVPFTTYVTPVR